MIVQTLKILCEMHKVRSTYNSIPIDLALNVLENNEPKRGFNHLANMDAYHYNNYLASILLTLTKKRAEDISETFGENAMWWLLTHSGDEHMPVIAKALGADPVLLRRAKLSARNPGNTVEVLNTYQLLANIRRAACVIDFDELLSKSIKEGEELPSKNMFRFRVLFPKDNAPIGHVNGYGITDKYQVGSDGPVCICLFFDEVPNAILGITGGRYESSGFMPQIQGVNQHYSGSGTPPTWGINSINWKELLVSCGEKIFEEVGFKKSILISSHNNSWANTWDGKPKLTLKTAAKIYDDPAINLGYRKKGDGNWHKFLNK